MDSRQQFEEWQKANSGMSLERDSRDNYISFATHQLWSAWQASREESDDMKSARRDLNKAIHALTHSLDYEWTGDFRPEIENLNGAHMRYKIKCKRARK